MKLRDFLDAVTRFCYDKNVNGDYDVESKCIVLHINKWTETLKSLNKITKEMIFTGKPFYYAIDTVNGYDPIILLVTLQYTAKVLAGKIIFKFLMLNQDKTERELHLTLDDIKILTESAYEIPTIDKTPLKLIEMKPKAKAKYNLL